MAKRALTMISSSLLASDTRRRQAQTMLATPAALRRSLDERLKLREIEAARETSIMTAFTTMSLAAPPDLAEKQSVSPFREYRAQAALGGAPVTQGDWAAMLSEVLGCAVSVACVAAAESGRTLRPLLITRGLLLLNENLADELPRMMHRHVRFCIGRGLLHPSVLVLRASPARERLAACTVADLVALAWDGVVASYRG